MPQPAEDWSKIMGPKPPPGQRQELDDLDTPPPAGMRKTVFVVPEGDVTVMFPELMSTSSAEDLEAYIKIWLRQIQRESAKPKNDEAAN
jgi:hypothetical protein